MALPNSFTTSVVGVTFVPGYPGNIFALNDMAAERFINAPAAEFGDGVVPEHIACVMVRNPANEFDSNAIEVHVPALGENAMIGHLPKNVASKVAPLIDSGEGWGIKITLVAVNQDHPEHPGVRVELFRTLTEEPF